MKIGVATFPNVDAPAPDRLGRMVEDRGLESLWFAEHSHRPVDGPIGEDSGRGDRYSKTFDPFVAMTVAAAATTTLKSRQVCVWCPNGTRSTPRKRWRRWTCSPAAE